MNLTIKTNFGEFNFDMDAQSAQEIVNQAFQKASTASGEVRSGAIKDFGDTRQAATEGFRQIEQASAGMAAIGKNLEAATRPAYKSRVEAMFGNRADWNTPAAPKKPTPQKAVPQGTPAADGYKGFMYIRCEKCGDVKGFCARHPMKFFSCGTCGHKFDLRGLRIAHVKCNCCGSHFDYKTNYGTEQFEIPCLRCGAPVDMELNHKGTTYVVVSLEK